MNNTPVYLELDRRQSDVLRKALDIRLHELRLEIVRTDDRRYRQSLKDDLEDLQEIDDQLERVGSQRYYGKILAKM